MIRNKFLLPFLWLLMLSTAAYAIPVLSKVPWSAVGQKIKSITTSNNTLLPTTMALRTDSDWIAAANMLTIPVYYFNPAMGLAASAVLAYADTAPMDAVKAFNDGKIAGQSAFQSVMDSLFPPASGGLPVPTSSSIIDRSGVYYQYSATWDNGGYYSVGETIGLNEHGPVFSDRGSYVIVQYFLNNTYQPWNFAYMANVYSYCFNRLTGTFTANYPPPAPSGVPSVMPNNKIDPYLEALRDIMNNRQNPNVPAQTAIKELLPQYTPPVPAIPAQSVTNYNTQNTTNNETASNTYNDTLTNIANNNPTNVEVQIEQAKQQEIGTATAPGLAVPTIKEVNFQPITDLRGTMMTTFPFSLVNIFSGILQPLLVAPVAPSFDIDLGVAQKTIDFSTFDSFASAFRAIAAFFLYAATAWYCVKLYSEM